MVMNKVAPFPQANDFGKIIKLLDMSEIDLKDFRKLQIVLGDVERRQVTYYLSALRYLDIIDEYKIFTDFGHLLQNSFEEVRNAYLSAKIISKIPFGFVYFIEKIQSTKLEIDDVVQIMKDNSIHLGSELIYRRRAQTILSWTDWVSSVCK